ncbi:MAG: GntR family transcriptional regulator [Pseudomonadales bacterium]
MKAAQHAYNTLRASIIDGSYPPGARVTEQEVSAAAGVSRTPVREALQRLESEGLLTVTAHQGAVVASWTHSDADDIFELRVMLEGYAARLAAQRASKEDIVELRQLASAQSNEAKKHSAGYMERIADLNNKFHERLQQAAASSRLQAMLATLSSAPLVFQTFRDYTRDDLNRSARHHVELVDAIESGDGDWAYAVMCAHVMAARRVFNAKH